MNKRWISKTAMTLGVLTMVGSAGAGLGSIAYAAPDAPYVSTNAISDDTSDRTITLWKYEIKSPAELKDRDNGEMLDPNDPKLKDKVLMEGVEFEIVRVIPNKNASGDYVKLDDPTKQKEGAANDYTIDPTFTAQTGKTGADGKLTFNVGTGKAADGIYLVREVPDANGDYWYMKDGVKTKVSTPMAPFFAYLPQTKRDNEKELIYDVHVYPKNIVNSSNGNKTVEGQKGYSIKAGQPFQWEATVDLPTNLYFEAKEDMTIVNRHDKDGNELPDLDVTAGTEVYADYFYIFDELNEELHLDEVELEAFDGTDWVKLALNTDYTVTVDDNAKTTNPISKVKDGTSTKVKIELTQAGMKKLEGNYTKIRGIYQTHTDVDFNGVIENKFDYGYLIPGSKPVTETPGSTPEYFDGGFTVDKTEEDSTKKLAGAEFYIATSKENADQGRFLASDGKTYKKDTDKFGAADTLPKNVTFLKDTTDENGHAQFNGLELDWYTDANKNGKQDEDEPTWDHADIERDYWLVETKSPDGFELLKDPIKVTIKLKPEDVKVHVENKTQTKLPFTGGTGTMLTIIIAIGAITIGTAAIAIDKKRRAV